MKYQAGALSTGVSQCKPMNVNCNINLGLACSHVDADATVARRLLDYHLSEREIAGFHSTETSHPPGFHIPKHFHDFASFYLVLGGSLTELYENKELECNGARNVKPVQYRSGVIR